MHVDTSASEFTEYRTLALSDAKVVGGFWSQRQAVNRKSSLNHAFEKLEASGNFNNLKLASGEGEGSYREPLFMDSDIYKWLEAVGYALANEPDAELRAKAEYAIGLLARTQEPDGYLNSYYQVLKPELKWLELAHGHELYCAGHLFEAAVAYHRGTGDRSLLDIAIKFADLIDREFGPGRRDGPPGHPEIELALVELARETCETRYAQLALFFLGRRGQGSLIGPKMFSDGYYQDRVSVYDAEELEGHAVRQLYLTSGMTDMYLETGDKGLWAALDRLWRDLAARKLHVTGGAGARHFGEAFGEAYELPNDTTYCETCAAIANVMWNWRLLLVTGDSKYADMLERSLYNSVLSGVSLDGSRYFYENPLSSSGGIERPSWYGCACCPPNLMRLVELIAHYGLTTNSRGVQLHQYMDGEFACAGDFGNCRLRVETGYPHEGEIVVTVLEASGGEFEIALREPSWSRGRAAVEGSWDGVETSDDETGYRAIRRKWQAGDRIVLKLDMAPRLTVANPRVDAARGAVAIERGPLVYCLEAVDNEGMERSGDLRIDPNAPLDDAFEASLLDGVHKVMARGWAADPESWSDSLYQTWPLPESDRERTLVAVPYYAWANRGAGAMEVWISCGTA